MHGLALGRGRRYAARMNLRVSLVLLLVSACTPSSSRIALDVTAIKAGLSAEGVDFSEFVLAGRCITVNDKCIDTPEACAITDTFHAEGTLDADAIAAAEVPACGFSFVTVTLYRRQQDGDRVAGVSAARVVNLEPGRVDVELNSIKVGEIEAQNPLASAQQCTVDVVDTVAVTIEPGETKRHPLPTGIHHLHCGPAGGPTTDYRVEIVFAERVGLVFE